jgi:hypothetical protein
MKSGLYIGFYVTSFMLILLPVAMLVVMVLMLGGKFGGNQATPFMVLVLLGVVQFLIVGTIIYFLVLGKMWGSLQDGQTPISAGKAIGFLFIPLFNYYWLFRAWGGFPKEYQNYSDRYSLNLSAPSSFAFYAYPAFQILSIIGFMAFYSSPFVLSVGSSTIPIALGVIWALSVLIQTILFLVVIAQAGKAVNNLKTVVQSRQAIMPQAMANQTFQPQMNIAG